MGKGKNSIRIMVFFVISLVFAGFFVYSLAKVRYEVSGTRQTELHIAEQSITHGIERSREGGLVYVEEETTNGSAVDTAVDIDTAVPEKKEPVKREQKPCPT